MKLTGIFTLIIITFGIVAIADGLTVRDSYKDKLIILDNSYALDVEYNGTLLDTQKYDIARRTIVLLRQKELIEGGYLDNDYDVDRDLYELDWINAELKDGVVATPRCEHLTGTINIYPSKGGVVDERKYA